MSSSEIINLNRAYANKVSDVDTSIYVCGIKNSYVSKNDTITFFKKYNNILMPNGGVVTAFYYEKQFTSNQPGWEHQLGCPCHGESSKAGAYFTDDSCWCDASGLFVDFDIKQREGVKTLTQEIINEVSLEVTKALYEILAQVDGVLEDKPQGTTGLDALVGPVTGLNYKGPLKHIQDTIVCFSAGRSHNGKGSLKNFTGGFYKEGIHLMYPGILLQRETKKRVIAYLRGLAKDPQSDLYRLLEKKIPNEFPEIVPGCYDYIDPSAAYNMTILYGSVKHPNHGENAKPCNYLTQHCNYFVFTNRDLDTSSSAVNKVLNFKEADAKREINLDGNGRKRTQMYMFNYNIDRLEKLYKDFNLPLEMSLVTKEYNENGDPTGLVRQVPYTIPEDIRIREEFLEYSKEYKSTSFAVNQDIKTRLEDKEVREHFEKNFIGFDDEVSEVVNGTPLQRVYNIVASLSRKRANDYENWYLVLIKLKQISAYFKDDPTGLAIGRHFSKRHNKALNSKTGVIDTDYFDEDYYIHFWNTLVVTVDNSETKNVPESVYFSNFYSLLSLVKHDNAADYMNFCDNDFMENVSNYIVKKKVNVSNGIFEIRKDWKIEPNEMGDVIHRYIAPFYKSGIAHGKKTWAEFDFKRSGWVTYPADLDQRIPASIDGFISKFIVDLINNVTSKFLRLFDSQVNILFTRMLPYIKKNITITSGYRSGDNDLDDDETAKDPDSVARVIGGNRHKDDDGDNDIDEAEDEEDEEEPLQRGGKNAKGFTKNGTLKLSFGDLARFFRLFIIQSIGGVTFLGSQDKLEFSKSCVVFKKILTDLKLCISPEIKANYFSHITAYNTYTEISKNPVNYIKNMSVKLFTTLRDDDFFKFANTDRLLFGVKNGVVELRHGDYPILHKGYHNFPVTMQMDCEYKQFDPTDPITIKVLRCLKDLFKDADHDSFDYVMKAMCLALDLDIHDTRINFIFGTGGNGKSTIINFMKYTFAEYASDMSVALITKGRNNKQAGTASPELLKHENKRFILISEANDLKFEPSVIKKITGGDALEGRALNSNLDRSFHVKAPIFITLNNNPEFTNDDEGTRRRIYALLFGQRFVDENVNITEAYQVRKNPECLKYSEDEKYRTAFLSILTFYYAQLSGVCHDKYIQNGKINANKDFQSWVDENPGATAKAREEAQKKFKNYYEDEYEHKPHNTFHVSIETTGIKFPTVEAASREFQKSGSQAFRFLSDRVYQIVNIVDTSGIKPLYSEKKLSTEKYSALPRHPQLSATETAAFRGIELPKENKDTNGIIINNGKGVEFRFTTREGADYKITPVSNRAEQKGDEEEEPIENQEVRRFPIPSFARRFVDLDFIIEQYESQYVNGKQRTATAELKNGFKNVLNNFAFKDNDSRFEMIFIDNNDYKKLSSIENIVKQNGGKIKPFSETKTVTGTPVSFKVYHEMLKEIHNDFLNDDDAKVVEMRNIRENIVHPFGYTVEEKAIVAPELVKRVKVNNFTRNFEDKFDALR